MAIKFETFNMPHSTDEKEISAEQKEEITTRVAKINASLSKKMKDIARHEAKAWKKSQRRG